MRVTEIQNATLGLVKLPQAPGQKPWRLTIQDKDTKEVIWVDLTQQIVDNIVSKLTGGIQVARTIPKQ